MDLLQIVLGSPHRGRHLLGGKRGLHDLFLQPAVGALRPQGDAIIANLNEKQRLPAVTGISAVLTITAGIALYWRDSDGFDPDWISLRDGDPATLRRASE
jgi:hypothetical protein